MKREMEKETAMPNFIKNEEAVLKFWEDNNCFKKLVAKNASTGKPITEWASITLGAEV